MTSSSDNPEGRTAVAYVERLGKKLPAAWELVTDHPVIGPLLEREARTGIVACIAPIAQPEQKFYGLAGQVTPEQHQRYEYHSGEKIDRLSMNPEDIASSESRSLYKFGGAIRGHRYYWSVSGLRPDTYDELLAVLIAVAVGDYLVAEALALLRRTKNEQARFFPHLQLLLSEK